MSIISRTVVATTTTTAGVISFDVFIFFFIFAQHTTILVYQQHVLYVRGSRYLLREAAAARLLNRDADIPVTITQSFWNHELCPAL